MFCGKCGKENADGAKFCIGCGTPLGDVDKADTATETEKQVADKIQGADKKELVEKMKALPKNILIGAGAAVIALIVIICIAGSSRRTINLDRYVTVEASGYDGYGTARVFVDWDTIAEKYGRKISYTKKAKSEHTELTRTVSAMESLKEFVSVSLDRSAGLSNGDTISYTWRVNDELGAYLKCKVKCKDGTYDVADLEEVSKFDAFEGLEVSFSGIAPNGRANIVYTGYRMDEYNFSCDKAGGLNNGDIVTVSIPGEPVYYIEQYGEVPETFKKEFEVVGLEEYVKSYADLTDDFLSELKSEAEDTIYAQTAYEYDSSMSLTDLEYAGYIMLDAKNKKSYDDGAVPAADVGEVSGQNAIYIIWKGNVSSSDGKFNTAKVYFPVSFGNIVSSDGELKYGGEGQIIGWSQLDDSRYDTPGYVNPFNCYMDIVEANRNQYTAECGDGFEIYSEYEVIETLSDISDEYRQTLYDDARDMVESAIANGYNEMKASDLSVAGEYLLTAKTQGSNFGSNNKYFVVYSATVTTTNRYRTFEPTTVYFPVEYDGIVKLPGDEYMTTASRGVQGGSYVADSYYYGTPGYTNGAEMFTQVVNTNRENYKYEMTEGLKQFGE